VNGTNGLVEPPKGQDHDHQYEVPDAGSQNQGRGIFEGGEGAGKNYSAVRLRNYQHEAIEAWLQNRCQGIFEMATGTGKTYTALGALKQLLEKERKLVTIISVPFLHLASQWEQNLHRMGMDIPIIHVSSANSKWRDELKTKDPE